MENDNFMYDMLKELHPELGDVWRQIESAKELVTQFAKINSTDIPKLSLKFTEKKPEHILGVKCKAYIQVYIGKYLTSLKMDDGMDMGFGLILHEYGHYIADNLFPLDKREVPDGNKMDARDINNVDEKNAESFRKWLGAYDYFYANYPERCKFIDSIFKHPNKNSSAI